MFSRRLLKESTKLSRRLSSLSIIDGGFNAPKPVLEAVPTIQKVANFNQIQIKFQPRSISLDIISPFYRPSIENPLINPLIETPTPAGIGQKEIIEKPQISKEFELPTASNNIHGEDGIQAAVLIGIRRKKMKKHKLRKLRKKMKFEWAKVRQKRELRKEKAFQAILIGQIKEAEKFSAEEFVAEKLRQANHTPIPRFWKGRQLPAFIVKQKMIEENEKKRKHWYDSIMNA